MTNLDEALNAMRKLSREELNVLNRELITRAKWLDRPLKLQNEIQARLTAGAHAANEGMGIGSLVTFIKRTRTGTERHYMRVTGYNRKRDHFTGQGCDASGNPIALRWQAVAISLCSRFNPANAPAVPEKKEATVFDSKACTVHALANAADIPFEEAHRLAAEAGRKLGQGFHSWQLMEYVNIKGIPNSRIMGAGEKMSLSEFIRKNPRGRFYIKKNSHAFAIVDGIVLDNMPSTGMGTMIKSAWKILK